MDSDRWDIVRLFLEAEMAMQREHLAALDRLEALILDGVDYTDQRFRSAWVTVLAYQLFRPHLGWIRDPERFRP